jgi:hypothetical protein
MVLTNAKCETRNAERGKTNRPLAGFIPRSAFRIPRF